MSTFRWVVSGLLTVLALGLISLVGIVFTKLREMELQNRHIERALGRIEGRLKIERKDEC